MKPSYEELEARCSALAAENAGLKQGTPDLRTMMSALDAFFADEEVPEGAMLAAYNILRGAVETPATDAFLAEVRAQGVEMLAAVLRRKGDDAFFDAIAEAQANAADQFAAQLRQEDAQ